ncbi:hypothetical protein RND81_02G032500 [Saponaria officinalis]|uniref:Uncharacterized protein n=1 Tax=Saponaria officinalis TaxID=3572 RepID=A0AAW1MUX4_SAPOF
MSFSSLFSIFCVSFCFQSPFMGVLVLSFDGFVPIFWWVCSLFGCCMGETMRKISIVIDRYMVKQILSDSWLQSITSEEINTRQGRFRDPLMVKRRLMDESMLRSADDRDSVAVDQSLNKNLFPMVVIDLYPFEFGICCRCRMTFY